MKYRCIADRSESPYGRCAQLVAGGGWFCAWHAPARRRNDAYEWRYIVPNPVNDGWLLTEARTYKERARSAPINALSKSFSSALASREEPNDP